jgi:hypothetical protein
MSISATPTRDRAGGYTGCNAEGYVRRFYVVGTSLMLSSNGGTGNKLVALGNGQFEAGPAVYRFWHPDTSAVYRVDRMETGHATRHFVPLSTDNRSQKPDPIAGTYTCSEVGSTWKITLHKDTVILQRPNAEDEALIPVFPDGYVGDSGLFRFKHNSAGAVTGFAIWSERIRNVDFYRQN